MLSNAKNILGTFLLLMFIGCGDDSYNCQNNDSVADAVRISYSMGDEFEGTKIEEIFNKMSELVKVNSIELLTIDDQNKYSTCKANFIFDPKNEKESKVIEKALIIYAEFMSNPYINVKSMNLKEKNEFSEKISQKRVEDFNEREQNMIENITKRITQENQTINYKMYDNGRGESYIQILKK